MDDFISQPLADQAAACLAWLTIDVPVLAPHRETIERWAQTAKAALRWPRRGARTLAYEHGLGRNYPDGFFPEGEASKLGIQEKKRPKAPNAE